MKYAVALKEVCKAVQYLLNLKGLKSGVSLSLYGNVHGFQQKIVAVDGCRYCFIASPSTAVSHMRSCCPDVYVVLITALVGSTVG